MDLTPYLDGLRSDLAAAAAPGGPEITRAADLLAGSLDASARLCLLEALSDATAEITAQLTSATVELRLRGRDADLVVTEAERLAPPPPPAPPAPDGADLARITLRLPEPLKEQVERAAATEGLSVNAWLVRAVGAAVHSRAPGHPGATPSGSPRDQHRPGRRITGFAQA